MGLVVNLRCRERLYRAIWRASSGPIAVYACSESKEAVTLLFQRVLGQISNEDSVPSRIDAVTSYDEMIGAGVSENEDLRIFEMQWRGRVVTEWVERPLFLTTDTDLLTMWLFSLVQRARLAMCLVHAGGSHAGVVRQDDESVARI
ncbi:hypothetical protein G3N57_03210 [Paraburkholderia sp. Se-20369]|nr:hypothetical protein [Paraburkholderia sp. Se-20369]